MSERHNECERESVVYLREREIESVREIKRKSEIESEGDKKSRERERKRERVSEIKCVRWRV